MSVFNHLRRFLIPVPLLEFSFFMAPVSTGDLLRPALSILQLIKTGDGSMKFAEWVVTKLR